MITVTRLDGSSFLLNADLIETVEATPDTVITFARDKKVVVTESPEEIVNRIIRYRRRIFADPSALVSSPEDQPTTDQTSTTHRGTGASRLHLVPETTQDPS